MTIFDRLIIILLLHLMYQVTMAQDAVFEQELSQDTLYVDHNLTLTYHIKNGEGKFLPPDLGDWHIISGPNQSTQMSIINGDVSSSKSYSYVLRPKSLGTHYIPECYYEMHDRTLEISPRAVIIRDNPDGIDQEQTYDDEVDGWDIPWRPSDRQIKTPPKKRKRYKTKKI